MTVKANMKAFMVFVSIGWKAKWNTNKYKYNNNMETNLDGVAMIFAVVLASRIRLI